MIQGEEIRIATKESMFDDEIEGRGRIILLFRYRFLNKALLGVALFDILPFHWWD